MITEKDLDTAIAECQGQRNPNANTCIKLAAFYTIKEQMFGKPERSDYSYAIAPDRNIINFDSGSEFAMAVNGKDPETVFPVIDELMETLKIIQPRLFDVVMSRLL